MTDKLAAATHARPQSSNGIAAMAGEASAGVRAGTARATVPLGPGLRLAGALRDGVSSAVHQDLTVTALYLKEGSVALVVIACDLILLPPEDAAQMRKTVGEATGLPGEQILLSVTHSHATPSPLSWGEYDYESTDDERAAVADFFAALQRAMIEVASRAQAGSVPVRIAAGSGVSDIAVNRRERQSDGTMVLGVNPSGPVDNEVAVLRIDRVNGEPLMLLFNYACHPDILGPKSSLISPDFVGPARDAAEILTGAPSLYMQGAAGDIYPRTGIVDEPDSVDAATRIGHRLGAEAGRVFETLNTRRRPACRTAWTSTASITTHWQYEDIPPPSTRQLGIARKVVSMPLRPLPTVTEAQALLAHQKHALTNLSERADLAERLIANRRAAWARVQLEAAEQDRPLELPLELQAIRIGDSAMVTVPGELFSQIGTAIKDTSPFAVTMVSAYTNGVYFYIPTRAAFEDGGYEVNSHQNYLRPAGPTEDWGDIITSEASALLQRLASGSL